MNVSNNINSLLTTTTTNSLVHNHININDLFQPSPPQASSSNSFIGMLSNNNHYPGFQDHHMNKEYYYPEVKERMLMFGGELSTTCSSSEANKHHHRIKQEDQFGLQGFGDQNHDFMTDHNNYVDQKPKGYFKTLEEVKQLIDIKNSSSSSINVNINSYLINDHDDENKTTHNIINDGCHMI